MHIRQSPLKIPVPIVFIRITFHWVGKVICPQALNESKGGEYMTGKEVVNLIRILKEKGISRDEILAIIEYIETHDPKEQE